MKNQLKKVLFGCLMAFLCVLVVSPRWAEAKESTKTIADYVSLSYGNVDNVVLTSSFDDFKSQLEMGAQPLFTPPSGSNTFGVQFSVTLNEPGYLLYRATGYSYVKSPYVKTYRDSSYSLVVREIYLGCYGVSDSYDYMPVEAGTYYFSLYNLMSFYIGFVPASNMCSVKGTKQSNGSVYIDITSLDKKAKITAVAIDGTKSAASCYKDSWLEGDYDSTNTANVAKILLPEAGKYTVMVEIEYSSECHNRFVYHINTKDLTGNSSKLETPISILAGTNVIVGNAEPGSTVYATYNSVDYSVKADKNGVYRLKVKSLKKNKTVKMWQVVNGKTTAEGSFKVVKKY